MECNVCTETIDGLYYSNPLFGEVACAPCVVDRKQYCDWCGRYKNTTVHMSKRCCDPCLSSSITDETQIATLIEATLPVLERHLGPTSYGELPVRFDGLVPSDYAPNPSGNAFFGGPDPHIRLMRGMPLGVAKGTLAHEYGHMALNLDYRTLGNRPGLGSRDKVIEEGFCEVMAAVAHLSHPSDDSRLQWFLMPGNPHPVYGDGFRLMWPRAIELGSVGALLQELTAEHHPFRGPAPDDCDGFDDDFELPDDIAPLVDAESGDRHKGVLRGTALHVRDLPDDATVGPRLRGKGLVATERDSTEGRPVPKKGTLRGAGLTEKKKPESTKPASPKGGLRGKGLDKK